MVDSTVERKVSWKVVQSAEKLVCKMVATMVVPLGAKMVAVKVGKLVV
jgi:hypothetical protein